MAYFLINKDTEHTIIAIDNTAVASIMGVHRHTITNWFKLGAKKKETDKYTVIKADEYIEPNKSSGNRDSRETRYRKANGEI